MRQGLRINKRGHTTRRGFTLTEIMVAMFIFSLMMTAVSQIFAAAFSGYRNTRAITRDLENAQYAINVMGKELRTSTVVSAGGAVQLVKFFDHSQDRCFSYRINASALQVASAASGGVTAPSAAPCDTMAFAAGAYKTITTGTVTGSFQVTPSATVGGPPTTVGKVTIALDISEGASHHARMQTTVSLRDFGNIGL